jgi:hypothetical protein
MLFVFLASCLFASDMELDLENGETVLLHDDHTWDFKSASSPDLTEDVSIILDNGEAVKIKENHTWYYIVRPSETSYEEVEYLGSAYSVGTAHHKELFEAKMIAIEQATEHLAKQLRSAVGDENLTVKKLSKCIEREDKSIEMQENIKNEKWRVQVNMSLDKYQIQMIIDCARESTE